MDHATASIWSRSPLVNRFLVHNVRQALVLTLLETAKSGDATIRIALSATLMKPKAKKFAASVRLAINSTAKEDASIGHVRIPNAINVHLAENNVLNVTKVGSLMVSSAKSSQIGVVVITTVSIAEASHVTNVVDANPAMLYLNGKRKIHLVANSSK